MPPKKKQDAASKKTEQKKKEKIIEDKTFGLKNKKGNKQQKFIKNVSQQVKYGNQSARKMDELTKEKSSKKEEKAKEMAELNALFRPVEQKVAKGVDAKSVLCMFYKQGLCKKGDKCKFSHDINVGRKGEKRSIYTDDAGEKDEMNDWDEAKLEEVVNKKHGEKNKSLPPTSIICKYFLEAVENSKYGWFWSCPTGEKCHYKHALPPGFQLKKDKKKEDEGEKITIEELIEKERAALSSQNLTKVTLESFMKWKAKKRKEKIANAKAETDKKKADFKAGKGTGISGREMFEFNPDLIVGDEDNDGDEFVYKREVEEEEEEVVVKEIDLADIAAAAQECDGTGTIDKGQRETSTSKLLENGMPDEEAGKLDMAAGGGPDTNATDEAISAAMAATADGLAGDAPIDENLFDGEDLDLVEDELETLELDD